MIFNVIRRLVRLIERHPDRLAGNALGAMAARGPGGVMATKVLNAATTFSLNVLLARLGMEPSLVGYIVYYRL